MYISERQRLHVIYEFRWAISHGFQAQQASLSCSSFGFVNVLMELLFCYQTPYGSILFHHCYKLGVNFMQQTCHLRVPMKKFTWIPSTSSFTFMFLIWICECAHGTLVSLSNSLGIHTFSSLLQIGCQFYASNMHNMATNSRSHSEVESWMTGLQ